jgi:hypothetical protein
VPSTQLLHAALAANGVVLDSTHCKQDCVFPGMSQELKHAAQPVDEYDGNLAALMHAKHRACAAAVVGMLPQSKHSCCVFGFVWQAKHCLNTSSLCAALLQRSHGV